jgi:membrane protein DedA with SNARE-associated domain
MHWRSFLAWNALGGSAWATSVALAAYYGGTGVERVFSKIGIYAVIVVGVVLIAVGAYLWRRHRRRRALAPAPAEATEAAAAETAGCEADGRA